MTASGARKRDIFKLVAEGRLTAADAAALLRPKAGEPLSIAVVGLAARFADTFGLHLAEPPFADLAIPLTLVGAAARANDPALVWLRARMREAAAEVFGG